MTDTNELREAYQDANHAIDVRAIADELDTLRTIIANKSRDWSEAHNLLLTATGTVVDDAGQPPLMELVERLIEQRDFAEAHADLTKRTLKSIVRVTKSTPTRGDA